MGLLDFHHYWKARTPLVLEGVPMLRDRWTPSYFKSCFGSEPCDIFDCEDGEERELHTNVADVMEYLSTGTIPKYRPVKKETSQKAKKYSSSSSGIFKLRV